MREASRAGYLEIKAKAQFQALHLRDTEYGSCNRECRAGRYLWSLGSTAWATRLSRRPRSRRPGKRRRESQGIRRETRGRQGARQEGDSACRVPRGRETQGRRGAGLGAGRERRRAGASPRTHPSCCPSACPLTARPRSPPDSASDPLLSSPAQRPRPRTARPLRHDMTPAAPL